MLNVFIRVGLLSDRIDVFIRGGRDTRSSLSLSTKEGPFEDPQGGGSLQARKRTLIRN